MISLLRYFKKYLSLQLLQEDLRKIGVGLIAAGLLSLFLTPIGGFALYGIFMSA